MRRLLGRVVLNVFVAPRRQVDPTRLEELIGEELDWVGWTSLDQLLEGFHQELIQFLVSYDQPQSAVWRLRCSHRTLGLTAEPCCAWAHTARGLGVQCRSWISVGLSEIGRVCAGVAGYLIFSLGILRCLSS